MMALPCTEEGMMTLHIKHCFEFRHNTSVTDGQHVARLHCVTAVAERPRDASCPSVVSLNKIITRAESFIIVM